MHPRPPRAPEPPVIRRWLTALRHTLIAFFTAPLAGLALGHFTLAPGSPWAMSLAWIPMFICGAGLWILRARRRSIIARARLANWRACPTCVAPLEPHAKRCSQCGQTITPEEAAAVWLASRCIR